MDVHTTLRPCLACPRCRGPVQVAARVACEDGRVKSGAIRCAACGPVGVVEHFKYDFHRSEAGEAGGGRERVVPVAGERRVQRDDPALTVSGNWWDDPRGYRASHGATGESIEYRGAFTDATVRLLTNSEGGVADVLVDGELARTVDTYRDGWFVLPVRAAVDLPYGEHTLTIRPRGAGSPASTGTVVSFEEVVLHGPLGRDGFGEPAATNHGNPFNAHIERYLAAVPNGGMILEAGGGDRRRANPHHANFEYLPYELADVYGDILQMPFANDAFAMAFSQAVFEHVPNPFRAAEEMIRVTRPGGIILTDVAFMQPVHAAPHHYFNHTLEGAKELFRSCEILETGWFGSLSATVDWMMRSFKLHDKAPADMERIVAELRRLDALVAYEDLLQAASGVYVVARKPG